MEACCRVPTQRRDLERAEDMAQELNECEESRRNSRPSIRRIISTPDVIARQQAAPNGMGICARSNEESGRLKHEQITGQRPTSEPSGPGHC
jgi:hypothetical protein